MDNFPTASELAQKMREVLRRGFDLSPETLRFIDSTFSHPTASELAEMLGDESCVERESLIELLFSADESFQIEIEELLAGRRWGPAAAETVAEILGRTKLPVTFRLPCGRGELTLPLTAAHARRLAGQLGIGRDLPSEVSEAIDACAAGPGRLCLRAMLRGVRFQIAGTHRAFLEQAMPELAAAAQGDRECLAFVLELLADIPPAADIFEAISARQQLLLKALNHGRSLRRMLAREPIETLLARGQRITWVDELETRRQMACLTRFCLAVFGRPPAAGAEGVQEESFAIEDTEQAAYILRRLCGRRDDSV